MSDLRALKIWILLELVRISKTAVLPPPWANPKLNPCATEPGGWQLLFWPPDGQCYKIFQTGYPCPEGMELNPRTTKSGPCESGHYFAPEVISDHENPSKQRTGTCKPIVSCPSSDSIFWPKDGKCYQNLSRGPCIKGQLLTLDDDGIPICSCDKEGELGNFRAENGRCYQHFTQGPCQEKGHLFLPDKTCGCHSFLPHFYGDTEKCYELGTIGPCSKGQTFTVLPNTNTGGCACKPGYIRYTNATGCYRTYTQGPCLPGEILVNSTSCITQPCKRGELVHPPSNRCFKIGSRGPCATGRVLSFDFETRPSLDGVSYNGVCMCLNRNCSVSSCDSKKGLILYDNECHKLYSQGPCGKGAWLAPKRQGRELLNGEDLGARLGVCECLPGHVRQVRMIHNGHITECLSPTSLLADYLNKNYTMMKTVIEIL